MTADIAPIKAANAQGERDLAHKTAQAQIRKKGINVKAVVDTPSSQLNKLILIYSRSMTPNSDSTDGRPLSVLLDGQAYPHTKSMKKRPSSLPLSV